MAFDDKEVEIKLEVTAAELERVAAELARTAKPVKTATQTDHYYSPTHNSYVAHKYPYEWLSVRERQTKCLLNYKHFYPEGAEQHDYCDEYEVAIDDPDTARKMLEALGFKHLVTVKKTRSEFVVGTDFTIALDLVEGLGEFIEVEALHGTGSGVRGARTAVRTFAENQLKLDLTRADPRGYPYQLLRKAGKI